MRNWERRIVVALLKKPRHGATEKNQNATGAGARAKTPGKQFTLGASDLYYYYKSVKFT